jgi:hypothetical protein
MEHKRCSHRSMLRNPFAQARFCLPQKKTVDAPKWCVSH